MRTGTADREDTPFSIACGPNGFGSVSLKNWKEMEGRNIRQLTCIILGLDMYFFLGKS